MKKPLKGGILILFLLFYSFTKGQINLVLNPSFEQHNGCGGIDDCIITDVPYWYNPTDGSPDWYNICGGAQDSVPLNFIGYQYPRTGNSYVGFVILTSPLHDGFEYIEGQFSKTLSNGKKYCVTFYTSLGDSVYYGTATMGAYISNNPVCMPNIHQDTLPFVPQISNPANHPLLDKINWVPISGEYTATGGEQYITIGGYDSTTIFAYAGHGGVGDSAYGQSYYYVDDVSLREIISAHAGRDTLICAGDKVLIGLDTAIGVSYHWLPVAGLSNPNNAQTFASPTVTTVYTLTVVNDSMKGCNCPDSVSKDSVTINVEQPFVTACCNSTITSGQSVILNCTPEYKYLWSPPVGLDCDTCQTVNANPTVTTTYFVTVYDSMGCSNSYPITITVKNDSSNTGPCGVLFVPDAFSPNGDGQNDIFLVKDNCVATFQLLIYDRWGNKVFESENINDGWDGNYKGKPEDAGTFMYDVQGTYTNGNSFTKKGSLTLVK